MISLSELSRCPYLIGRCHHDRERQRDDDCNDGDDDDAPPRDLHGGVDGLADANRERERDDEDDDEPPARQVGVALHELAVDVHLVGVAEALVDLTGGYTCGDEDVCPDSSGVSRGTHGVLIGGNDTDRVGKSMLAKANRKVKKHRREMKRHI